MEKNETFHYTYSAQQQAEVKRIRDKYVPAEEEKMTQLRRLDRSASQKAQAASIAVGVLGALILGLGMSLAMTQLGEQLADVAMPLGVAIGIAGLALVALAYPAYNHILEKERERIAPQILRLTDELLHGASTAKR